MIHTTIFQCGSQKQNKKQTVFLCNENQEMLKNSIWWWMEKCQKETLFKTNNLCLNYVNSGSRKIEVRI